MIPSPKHFGNDIDIFLQPLIDDLKLLWDDVEVYNVVSKSNFNLRVVLMWTINDFPVYGILLGVQQRAWWHVQFVGSPHILSGCTIVRN